MSKRFLSVLVFLLVASVFCSAAAHACADLRAMQTMLQASCGHGSSQNEPLGKKDNCDSVRYGMLATQASLPRIEVLKPDASSVYASLPVSDVAVVPLRSRSQAPPSQRCGISPRHSHVVLRI